MKTKMCICELLVLAISLSSTVLGAETAPFGTVYGPKAGFSISAPEGWVADNESGKEQDMPCVLYPKGSSWLDAKTVMYANIAGPEFEGVNAFVATAIEEMKAKRGIPKEKIATGKTKDGHDYFINEYPARKAYSQWERVGYIQLPQGVAFIVLSSRDQASYRKDSGALEKVLKTLVYLEPKSESASGQEYARRYRQLLDQHADAQIEPLLTEWREKAPDDPDAWITSANYYFNQRQTNISTKKPSSGDITLTDQKTGKIAGSISFEQNESGMKRATELLQEARTKFPDHLDIWCGLAFMYQESGDFDNELSTLKKMVAYAREHPTQLKWLKGAPLSEPADKFVPEKLHEYGQYYEKQNPEDDKRWFQISTLAAEQYPNHPEGFNDAAGYWTDIGEWQKARELVEKAHQLNPKSVGALLNLGNISVQMKDFSSARKYFEDAVKLDPNGQYGREAKDALRKLKKK
jgi:tetratricopeptide (TPR) repeat protein